MKNSVAGIIALVAGTLSPPGPAIATGIAPTPATCIGDARHGWLVQQNVVLLTNDGGRTWRVSFRGQFQQASSFAATVGCSGAIGWVLFVGPGAAMNQKPYVLYLTRNGGRRWTAVMEEGYFGSLYPTAHARRSLGAYPGPFDVVGPRVAFFLGSTAVIGVHGAVELSRTTDTGRTWQQSTIPCLYAPDPTILHFTSATRGWVVGTCNGRETVMLTSDGGRTWSRRFVIS